VPLKFAVEDATNPDPFTVRVSAAEPTDPASGETEVIAGIGLSTAKIVEFEDPPPGNGFVTTTLKFPADANSAVVSPIVNSLALMKLTLCNAPLELTEEEEMKPEPLIAKFCAVEPRVRDEGEMLLIAGIGFGVGGLVYGLAPHPASAIPSISDEQPVHTARRGIRISLASNPWITKPATFTILFQRTLPLNKQGICPEAFKSYTPRTKCAGNVLQTQAFAKLNFSSAHDSPRGRVDTK
jgi:hypothetical protein